MLGSLLGVVLMLLASYPWTPPLVWFALCFMVFSYSTSVATPEFRNRIFLTAFKQGRGFGRYGHKSPGAIFGGLLEYNSMYFGFRSLYVVAMVCYVLAFVAELPFWRKTTQEIPSPMTARL